MGFHVAGQEGLVGSTCLAQGLTRLACPSLGQRWGRIAACMLFGQGVAFLEGIYVMVPGYLLLPAHLNMDRREQCAFA